MSYFVSVDKKTLTFGKKQKILKMLCNNVMNFY